MLSVSIPVAGDRGEYSIATIGGSVGIATQQVYARPSIQPETQYVFAGQVDTSRGKIERHRRRSVLLVYPDFARAVSAYLESADKYVHLIDSRTGIFGVGQGMKEAAQDLHDAINDHRELLVEQTALSPELQYQLDRINSYLADALETKGMVPSEGIDCPLSKAQWGKPVTTRCSDGRNPYLGR